MVEATAAIERAAGFDRSGIPLRLFPAFRLDLPTFIRTRTVKTFDCDIACNFGRKNCLSDDGL
jgi:hypothetical protein